MRKQGRTLVIDKEISQEKFQIFLTSLQEGAMVDVMFQPRGADGTKAQIAKIHACINQIAKEQGQSVEETKLDLKHKCGLYTGEKGERQYKSFAECTKDELSDVIENIIQIGVFLNINLGNLIEREERPPQ